MDYNLDLLSSMDLGGAELFPDYALTDGLAKDEPGNIFKDQPLSGGVFSQPALTTDNDAFPDWLDLKMDFSILEGLEASDNVLDDLLQCEVGYSDVTSGQLLDDLPPLPMENKAPPSPLDLEQLPYERQPLLSNEKPAPAVPSVGLDVVTSFMNPPPSSPDWIVPEVGEAKSPSPLFSPSLQVASPVYSFVTGVPLSPPPSPAEGTVLTFVAPVVQPVPVIDTAEVIVETRTLPLDNILSFSFLLSNANCSEQEKTETEVSEGSLPPSPATIVEKKRVRKVKAASNRRPKVAKVQSSNESESDESSIPVSKKERKRKQNKDAAMRYRMKKRMETDCLADEEGELMEQNQKLKEKAQQLAGELGYLKNLMREMFKVRGLLK